MGWTIIVQLLLSQMGCKEKWCESQNKPSMIHQHDQNAPRNGCQGTDKVMHGKDILVVSVNWATPIFMSGQSTVEKNCLLSHKGVKKHFPEAGRFSDLTQ